MTSPATTDWHDLNLLLVEDNEDHQGLVSGLLRKLGANVAIVARGEDAVQAVRASLNASEPFGLILMDIGLPTLDGYEATQQIRASGYTGPIVAITAWVMEKDIEKCHDSGCDACIRKPFDRVTLCDTIAELLAEVVSDR